MSELFTPKDHEIVDATCIVCGCGIRTTADVDCDPIMLRQLLRSLACNSCAEKRKQNDILTEAAQRLERRSTNWQQLCPPEFRKPIDFNRPGAKRVNFDDVMKWKYDGRGLLVHGRTSRCKTRFLFSLMEREYNEGKRCAYVAHADYRREISWLAQTDAAALKRYMEVLLRADLVLFDDLGNGVITPTSEEAFEMLLASRTRNGLPFLFSTNETTKSLQAKFSPDRQEPIMRRIIEFTTPIDFGH